MNLPRLPTPESIDGRLLYTAGQMREYAKAFSEACMANVDASRQRHNASGQQQNDNTVDFLRGMMGMK